MHRERHTERITREMPPVEKVINKRVELDFWQNETYVKLTISKDDVIQSVADLHFDFAQEATDWINTWKPLLYQSISIEALTHSYEVDREDTDGCV